MKFLIVLLAAFCVAQAQITDGVWRTLSSSDTNLNRVAEWARIRLPSETKTSGSYTILDIRNAEIKAFRGDRDGMLREFYKFTLDVLLTNEFSGMPKYLVNV